MRKSVSGPLLVCVLTFAPVTFGAVRDRESPAGNAFRRIVRTIIRHIVPSTLGDSLSPPKPEDKP